MTVAAFGADGAALSRLPVAASALVAVAGLGGSASAIEEDLAGKVALIDRGECAFTDKARAAQDKGAVGVIIVNNAPGPPFQMATSAVGDTVTIPALMVSQADGAALRGMASAVVDIANTTQGK